MDLMGCFSGSKLNSLKAIHNALNPLLVDNGLFQRVKIK